MAVENYIELTFRFRKSEFMVLESSGWSVAPGCDAFMCYVGTKVLDMRF